MTTGAERRLAVEHWLLCSAPNCRESLWEWREDDVTFLRCGARFTALRLSGAVVHAAAGTADPVQVGAYLAEVLDGGPVIAAHGLSRHYALVSPMAARSQKRREPVAECLPPRTLLGVPPVARTTYQAGATYWAVPMDSPGELCIVALVDQLARRGQRCLNKDA
ncbi:hypothetical protein [Streptomyces sp. NPDC003393]